MAARHKHEKRMHDEGHGQNKTKQKTKINFKKKRKICRVTQQYKVQETQKAFVKLNNTAEKIVI